MDSMEKLLRLAADMEALPPKDKLTGMVSHTMGYDIKELSEWDLDLVSAAGEQAYQNFLSRLNRKDES